MHNTVGVCIKCDKIYLDIDSKCDCGGSTIILNCTKDEYERILNDLQLKAAMRRKENKNEQ